jgi:hypothetical protein
LDTYGIDFIKKIDSMHAFVYYDVNKQKLYLSRDHVGIKPLYYAKCKQGLVFASEIRAIKHKVSTHHEIDAVALSSWSHLGCNFTRNTFYKGISRLMPGECWQYDIPTKQMNLVHRIIPETKNTRRFDAEAFFALEQIKQHEAAIQELFIYQGRAGLWDDWLKFQAEAKRKRDAEAREIVLAQIKRKEKLWAWINGFLIIASVYNRGRYYSWFNLACCNERCIMKRPLPKRNERSKKNKRNK